MWTICLATYFGAVRLLRRDRLTWMERIESHMVVYDTVLRMSSQGKACNSRNYRGVNAHFLCLSWESVVSEPTWRGRIPWYRNKRHQACTVFKDLPDLVQISICWYLKGIIKKFRVTGLPTG